MMEFKKTMALFLSGFSMLALLSTGCSGGSSGSDSSGDAAVSEVSTDPMKNKGIGPVTSVTLGEIDNTLADTGKAVFVAKCSACHKMDVRVVGPPLAGVTTRRTPEWIMNQILNPTEMAQKDPIAKELLATYIAQMANQNLSQDEARSVLEYFRQYDKK